MLEYYDIAKAIHVMSIISWMAALFYLPRLFVYHSEYRDKKEFQEIVKLQEKRLYYCIAYPAMIAALLSGSFMVKALPELFKSGMWLHIKLTFVLLLIAFHFACGFYRKRLLKDVFSSGKFFRIFNEIPTLLMIVIVVMAIVKPF